MSHYPSAVQMNSLGGREEDYSVLEQGGRAPSTPGAWGVRRRRQRDLNEISLSRETLQGNICDNVMLINFLQFTAQI